jgi:hypothetical protein
MPFVNNTSKYLISDRKVKIDVDDIPKGLT